MALEVFPHSLGFKGILMHNTVYLLNFLKKFCTEMFLRVAIKLFTLQLINSSYLELRYNIIF